MKNKILVVEDEISINDILTSALKADGYETKSAFMAKEAKSFMEKSKIDLVLLDINLPDENGFDLCKFINSNYAVPIIILTARNDIVDKVLGLELGADDYITKPFHIKEVLARVKTALRRIEKYKTLNDNTIIKLNNNITIDIENRIVMCSGKEIKFKPKEFDLLEFLCRNRNKVFSREQLLDSVWGVDYEGELRTVDVHVRRIRSKLENGNEIIETVFGVGYVMR